MDLQIALKGEYFDAIQRGEKTEEYRLVTPYWTARLSGRDYDNLILTRGYPKRGDDSRRMDFEFRRPVIKTITHPHFGDKPVEVFAIPVGHEPLHYVDVELYRANIL